MEYPAWEESYGGRRTWATTNINNAHAAGWLLYKQIVLSRPAVKRSKEGCDVARSGRYMNGAYHRLPELHPSRSTLKARKVWRSRDVMMPNYAERYVLSLRELRAKEGMNRWWWLLVQDGKGGTGAAIEGIVLIQNRMTIQILIRFQANRYRKGCSIHEKGIRKLASQTIETQRSECAVGSLDSISPGSFERSTTWLAVPRPWIQ